MDELVLNTQIVGDGPPLLLVHGFGISFNIWKGLVPLLRPYFTLVMVELPGIGKSPISQPGRDYLCAATEALKQVRCDLGFDTWDVLGYSTGSRIAEAYVQIDAEHVRKAIFLCPLKVKNYKLLILRFGLLTGRIIPGFIPWVLNGWRLKLLIFIYGFSFHSNAYMNEWQAEIRSAPVQVLIETAKLVIPVGTRPFFVPVPFSLIWGDKDLVANRPRIPEKRDHFIHASHAAPILAPEEISDIIINYFDRS